MNIGRAYKLSPFYFPQFISFLKYDLAGDNGCMDRAIVIEQNQVGVFSGSDGALFVFEAQ